MGGDGVIAKPNEMVTRKLNNPPFVLVQSKYNAPVHYLVKMLTLNGRLISKPQSQ
jgi:hypothetical protein